MFYEKEDGTKVHYPASMIWKVGVPAALVVGFVLFMFVL